MCWLQERSEAIDIPRYLMQSTASMSDPLRKSGLGSVLLKLLREMNIVLHFDELNLSSLVELHVPGY